MTATRRVHQLRITAPRDDLARRGALLLEDALHTASLPDDGRVLVVRTLRVGTLRVGRASASVARDVEQSVTELASRAVHALDPSAASADVVYFRDVHESIAALAIRIALQRSTSAWFWRLAVPAWRPNMSRDEALRALLFAALETPSGHVGQAELVRTLAENDALGPMLDALRAPDGAQLLAVSGWRAAVPHDHAVMAPAETHGIAAPEAAKAILRQWVTRWGARDARSAWLACVLLVAERPLRAVSDDLPRRARALVRAVADDVVSHEPEGADERTGTRADKRREVRGPAERAPHTTAAEAGEQHEHVIAERHAPDTGPDAGGNDVRSDEPSNAGDDPAAIDAMHADDGTTIAPPLCDEDDVRVIDQLPTEHHEPKADDADRGARREAPVAMKVANPQADTQDVTAFGGLFLLLPVMARLGLPAQLQVEPDLIEADFPRRLLHYLAVRLGADPRDPARRSVAPDEEDNDAWRPALVQWTMRMRAWCRTNTGLPMRAIARRHARIAATPTHIDVHFPLSQVDLRIRRTGLDIDPGWLPWFGRVVRFHYDREERPHGA